MQTLVLLVPPLLIFICLYAGIVKLAARLLRYTLSWKLSFVFAIAMLIIAIASRALQFASGHSLPLWLALILLLVVYVVLGAWLFAERTTNASGQTLGWRGGVRLSACPFLLMAVFALLLLGVSFLLHSFHLYESALTNRWSQPLDVVMTRFNFMKRFSMLATLALASGGSAPSPLGLWNPLGR
jgi:hypothetical protein